MGPDASRKLIYLTAGAGGMFCGSCLHDNALARALAGIGWDTQLVPTYTPIRTDESDFSVDQVFFGGINVYLQQKIPLLLHLPRFLDRMLDDPRLIRRVTSGSIQTSPKLLGELAVSMLKGPAGNQRKEVFRLIDWLAEQRPDVVMFTNALIAGCVPELKRRLDVPVLITLQGDDVFLDHLPPKHKSQCVELIAALAESVDGFIVHSEAFRGYMAGYLGIPVEKIHVTPLGIDVFDFEPFLDRSPLPEPPPRLGYLARLSPEKGLHLLVEAFLKLKQDPRHESLKLELAGWLGEDQRAFAETQFRRLDEAGLGDDYRYHGSVDREGKLNFLSQLDLFSVPAVFFEPKGLYALEALAAGVPVVGPNRGCFVEMLQESGGGQLFESGDAADLAVVLDAMLSNPEASQQLARDGQRYVHQERNARRMAESTGQLLESFLS